jgi:predicted ArsR family transcriptional regulator
MQYTRKQIIEYLEINHAATVSELSQRLNLTVTNIRHHVKELEHRELIQEIGQFPGGGRGRPTKVYGLTAVSMKNNLPHLTNALLQVFLDDEAILSGESTKDRCRLVAENLVGNLEQESNSIYRLNQGVSWLNQQNYQARWEASAYGPKVILAQCPYREVYERFPGICQLDIAILCRLFGVEWEQITLSHQSIPGSQQCTFILE